MLFTTSKMKFCALLSAFLCFLLHIPTVVAGVKSALSFCATTIVPSLFVFLVFSNILLTVFLSGNATKIPIKWYVYALGAFCGFPVGAILCDRLHALGVLSEKDVGKLLPFCNNASPAFVLGAIGNSMFNDIRLGILLFLSQTVISFTACFFMKIHSVENGKSAPALPLPSAFFEAVEKSIGGILRICAMICLFTPLLSILKLYCEKNTFLILSILLEIGNGAVNAGSIYAQSPLLSLALCGFLCGWSGICVHLQVFSSLRSVKARVFPYLFWKFLLGVLTAVLTVLGYKLLLGLEF